jgi:hypothetical protein
MWVLYSDNSIRPKKNNQVCIEANGMSLSGSAQDLSLERCNQGSKQFYWLDVNSDDSRRLSNYNEESVYNENVNMCTNLSIADSCSDNPLGWYDKYGRNCHWYSQGDNCCVYGGSYQNFGKTAMEACCACGANTVTNDVSETEMILASDENNSCWDIPNWYDSAGDDCNWYEDGENCDRYGDQFESTDGLSAKSACCICGGGLSSQPTLVQDWMNLSPGCSDDPFGWFNTEGFGCDWYAQEPARNCMEFGESVDYNGVAANKACCACGGGFDVSRSEVGMSSSGALAMECSISLLVSLIVWTGLFII